MGSEYKFVLFLVLAVIFLAIHCFFQKVQKHTPETLPAVGTIERINQDDRGDAWYYVSLVVDGNAVVAKTDSYLTSPEDLCIGDQVNVQYYPIANGGFACYIQQEGFQRVIGSTGGMSKPIMLYAALASFAVFLFSLVKHLLT